MKAAAAVAAGKFKEEIVPVHTKVKCSAIVFSF
jgi:acetyl-CoA acetyltransferase